MKPVTVGPVTMRREGDVSETFADLDIQGETQRLWYRFTGADVTPAPEAFVAAALLPAMSLGAPLHVEDPLSPKFLAALDVIQDIYESWEPPLAKVPVQARAGEPRKRTSSGGIASFFSGGVDSYYTLQKHRDEITHAIMIWGFDIPLDEPELKARIQQKLRSALATLEKQPIEVETNHRALVTQFHLVERLQPWLFAHGTCLAAVALQLEPSIGTVLVPASVIYNNLIAWGSHPLLDPLWSTEGVAMVHDGCERNRVGKIESVLGFPTALETLRVCGNVGGGSYNCCRCEKCVVFMLCLHALGALERCETVDANAFAELPTDRLLNYWVNVTPHTGLSTIQDALGRMGFDPARLERFEQACWGKSKRGGRFRREVRREAEALLRAGARHYAEQRRRTHA